MKRKVFILLLAILVVFSCTKKPEKTRLSTEADAVSEQAGGNESADTGPINAAYEANPFENFLENLPDDSKTYRLPDISKSYKGNVKQNFPAKYLADSLVFKDIPLQSPYPGKEIALVGYDKTKLYSDPFASGKKGAQALSGLRPLKNIPIGTILPILAEYRDDPTESNESTGLYNFEKEWNYFYLTEYEGQRGVVFGADIFRGDRGGNDQMLMRKSYFYTKPQSVPAFVRTAGLYELNPKQEKQLLESYIAFAQAPQYQLDIENPDDLVALYKQAFADRAQTVFVSTDLLVHTLHLLFDRMLTETEDRVFIPRLKYLIEGLSWELQRLIAADTKESAEYTKALELAGTYLLLGKALLAMAPPLSPEHAFSYEPEQEVSMEQVQQALEASLPPKVLEEFYLIMDAKDFKPSPNFGYREDYSQFIPRGHYTKNNRLKAYFRTMMFFGRINLYLDFSTPEAEKVSKELGPVALILCQLLQRATSDFINTQRSVSGLDTYTSYKALWDSLFSPITYLIGESDDVNLYNIEKAEPDIAKLDIFRLFKTGKMLDYLKKLAEKLPAPRIQGNITYGNANAANKTGSGDLFGEAPRGFRLFGQRFVLDSSWTDRLTGGDILAADGQRARTMASGLDIAASLGSATAYALLEKERRNFPLYDKFLGVIKSEVQGMKEDEWKKTFYLGYLDTVGRILSFEQGAGFYFTQKPLWSIKTLQTGLAAWAELRHDTILYVKQSGAEMAGGGGIDATYRTINFPRPIHYVEPNLRFFYGITGLIERSLPLLKQYKFLTAEWAEKFGRYIDVLAKLTAIVEKEVIDAPISNEENEYIVSVPGLLARIIRPEGEINPDGSDDKFKMAMVADVHTDADADAVLEVATGKPFMIYVALNDGQGGKRIAVGFTYSYYEFTQPMNDRLTDEKWKAFIYANPAKQELEAKRPAWLRGLMP